MSSGFSGIRIDSIAPRCIWIPVTVHSSRSPRNLGKIRPRLRSPTACPARPTRWRPRAVEPGASTSSTRSTAPMSIPSSSELVATMQRRRPALRRLRRRRRLHVRRRHHHLQVDVRRRRCVHDLHRPVAAEELRGQVHRPHGGREADPLRSLPARQLGQPLERQSQVSAALGRHHGVDLVDDHGPHRNA